jgi:hypothetical protein
MIHSSVPELDEIGSNRLKMGFTKLLCGEEIQKEWRLGGDDTHCDDHGIWLCEVSPRSVKRLTDTFGVILLVATGRQDGKVARLG